MLARVGARSSERSDPIPHEIASLRSQWQRPAGLEWC